MVTGLKTTSDFLFSFNCVLTMLMYASCYEKLKLLKIKYFKYCLFELGLMHAPSSLTKIWESQVKVILPRANVSLSLESERIEKRFWQHSRFIKCV